MSSETLTPMMRQYKELKERYSDCLLFFRLGDFYELFFDDAILASRLLNLTLTKRHTAPMCGIPHHALESYLGRLTRLGGKVAICEQLSDPSLPGIVERDVIRVVTPGTTFDERILDQKSHRFIISVIRDKEHFGLALCEATTGLFQVCSVKDEAELKDAIAKISPAECIVDAAEQNLPAFLKQFEKLPVFPHQCWDPPAELLAKQFGVKDLRGFGIHDMASVMQAAALLVSYLRETQKSDVAHIRPPQLIDRRDEMILDETAVRNLELFQNLRDAKREGALISVIDMTKTSMGGRTLRQWFLHPLHNASAINARLDAITEILADIHFKTKLPEILAGVLDMERLLGRISIGGGSARDVLGIGISLNALSPTKELLKKGKSQLLKTLYDKLIELQQLEDIRREILNSLVENPPLSTRDGGIICDGINNELDELRALSREGKDFIQKLQQSEIEKTKIQSLKVRYNQVFGYYIEITKANLHLVPQDYIRKQTLVNCERFITPQLKEYEEKVLGAEEKIKELEYKIFCDLRSKVKQSTRAIQDAAAVLGMLDAILSLALTAEKNRYSKPEILSEDGPLVIKNGRHPVVEQLSGGRFVPNDLSLGKGEGGMRNPSTGLGTGEEKRVILLTGPNMGGKSTYLRQTALIVLLAHMGSFVPADEAKIPLTDRIFTRVGASDNLAGGQSTFMVEMQETSQILHYATAHSLIILDEVGRGTSTYDGVSLAWAILEYIHDHIGAKTLFATHYHELIRVAEKLPHAANFSVAVEERNPSTTFPSTSLGAGGTGEESGKRIVFLYRVKPGAIDRSYGIEVARLAGLPKEVVLKAKTILRDLEEGILDEAITARAQSEKRDESQLSIFQERPHRVIEELKKVDLENLTPLQALQKLDELKRIE